MLGGFGFTPGAGTAMSARHCAQAEKCGGVRVKFIWKWDRGYNSLGNADRGCLTLNLS